MPAKLLLRVRLRSNRRHDQLDHNAAVWKKRPMHDARHKGSKVEQCVATPNGWACEAPRGPDLGSHVQRIVSICQKTPSSGSLWSATARERSHQRGWRAFGVLVAE